MAFCNLSLENLWQIGTCTYKAEMSTRCDEDFLSEKRQRFAAYFSLQSRYLNWGELSAVQIP